MRVITGDRYQQMTPSQMIGFDARRGGGLESHSPQRGRRMQRGTEPPRNRG
jgi:hypothetical protein